MNILDKLTQSNKINDVSSSPKHLSNQYGNGMYEIKGIVTKLIFPQAGVKNENDYVIFLLKDNSGDDIVCKGTFVGLTLNSKVILSGFNKKESHQRKHGVVEQNTFSIVKYKIDIHQSLSVFSNFLNGSIPDLGIRRATKISNITKNMFPKKAIEVKLALSCNDEMAEKWFNEIENIRINEEMYIMLNKWGFSSKMAKNIIAELGDDVLFLPKNPYLLTKVSGVGFEKADKLAQEIFKIDPYDINRLKAGIEFSLLSSSRKYGHTCAPARIILEKTDTLLKVKDGAKKAFVRSVQDGDIVLYPDEDKKYGRICSLKYMDSAERYIAKDVSKRLGGGLNVPDRIKRRYFSSLKPSQLAAAENCFNSKFSILTGGPGVGKTWTAKSIVDAAEAMGFTCALAAPTGKAAKRLSQCTNKDASTIHRLLGSKGDLNSFEYNEYNKLPHDFILIDELSMCDIEMVAAVLKASKNNAHVLFIGDPDQLKSIKAGNVLKDLIDEKSIPVHRLNEILRVDDGSLGIIHGSRNIIQGIIPSSGDGMNCSKVTSERDAYLKCIKSMNKFIKMSDNPIEDIQFLTAMHKGDLGTINMNMVIRPMILNSMGIDINDKNSTPIRYGEKTINLVRGDKVIQTAKNYADIGLFNGDVGIVLKASKREITILVDGKEIELSGEKMFNLQPAYALSIHKSQGSGYKYVCMPVVPSQNILLNPNLIYTGVTRTETSIDLIYEESAMNRALDLSNVVPRFTHLPKMLKEELSSLSDPKSTNQISTLSIL